jgi:hypothetical protein
MKNSFQLFIKCIVSSMCVLFLAGIISPGIVLAGGSGPGPTGTGGSGPGPTSPGGFDIDFENPLKADSLQCLVYDIFRIAINLLAVVAGLFIIYSGFKFVAAQGNPEKLKAARRVFLNTIIGTAIILGSWVIVQFAVNTINQFMDRDVITINNTCEE